MHVKPEGVSDATTAERLRGRLRRAERDAREAFLDHPLRWGNSLIGTDVRTVQGGLTSESSISTKSRRDGVLSLYEKYAMEQRQLTHSRKSGPTATILLILLIVSRPKPPMSSARWNAPPHNRSLRQTRPPDR